jgi:hypothetical protein
MAKTLKKLFNGTLTDSSGTKYTVPALTTTIVKEITLCNYSGAAVTVTVTFDGTKVVGGQSIPAGNTIVIELHSILEAGDIIAGLASANSSVDMMVSGIEVA